MYVCSSACNVTAIGAGAADDLATHAKSSAATAPAAIEVAKNPDLRFMFYTSNVAQS